MILGAEKKIVFLSTLKPTVVKLALVNTVGVLSSKKAIEEQKLTSIKDVSGVEQGDGVYEILQAVFSAGALEVVLHGVVVEDNNYTKLFDVKNDWFGTVTDETDLVKLKTISKEISARDKMLFAQVVKTEDITQVESKVKAIGEDTTALFFSKNDESLAGAVAGYTIPRFPGSILIANKLINSTIDSGITGREQGILDNINCNYNAYMKGQLGLANGVTVTGDSIDFIHCLKALKFRLEEDMTLWLKATPKPTFYDLSSLKSVILTRCKQFENMGALAQDRTTITFPKLEDIPKNDILNGVLTGVRIEVYYTFGVKELRAELYFAV